MGENAENNPDGQGLTVDHALLIALLASIVMFEGFDIAATSVVLPYIGKEFGVSSGTLGNAVAFVALGAMAAWFLLQLADRFGRRPVLLLAAAGFSLGSLATAFAPSVHAYAGLQFLTRALLVTQLATSYLIVSETLPPRIRGRANGLMGAIGAFGAALPFLVIGPALNTPMSWRLVFVIGALPLALMPLLIWRIRETPIWLDRRKRGAIKVSAIAQFRKLISPELRRSFVGMSLLWFVINFASAVSSVFFTLYVVSERHWSPGDLARTAPFGLAAAFLGNVAAGQLADRIGRRTTMALFLGALGILIVICYSSTNWYAIAGAFVLTQAALGVWSTAYTVNSELFPTELRASANGWCQNLIGRWGMALAPALLGFFSTTFKSIGMAATIISVSAWLAIPVVIFLLRETRGQRLERTGGDAA